MAQILDVLGRFLWRHARARAVTSRVSVGLAPVLLGALLAACTTTSSSTSGHRSSDSLPAVAAGLDRTSGPGWSDSGLEGPLPAPGSCRYRSATDGFSLPDPSCTPGAVDSSVTQRNLGQTVCSSSGYTSHIRPPESLTEPFKYASMSAYGADAPAGSYEIDHLVPLEIGGSSDTRNLWPEPDDHPSPGVANSKDIVEGELHRLVCNAVHRRPYLPLSVAQTLIASDWTTAVAMASRALVRP